jgi:hypothetical protein
MRMTEGVKKARNEARKVVPRPDVLVEDQGTIIILVQLTETGEQWVNENLQTEPWQWVGGAVCVDHRMAAQILEGMEDDGLKLSYDARGLERYRT